MARVSRIDVIGQEYLVKDFHNGPAPGAKADAQACQAIGLGQGTQDEEMIGISTRGRVEFSSASAPPLENSM